MDVYLTSLAIGGLGLVAMALSGTSRHGQQNAGSGGARGASGHGSGHGPAHSATGGHGGSHAGSHGGGHSAHGHTAGHAAGHHASSGHAPASQANQGVMANALLSVMSPRVLFSVCLGLGTTGLLLRNSLGGVPLFLAAVAGGALFERLIVTPIWNFAFRFASNPALTLESALMSEATAVTRFDANGQGLIAIEVDGHVVQLLGTLEPTGSAAKAQVPVGARLRVEDVDAARNRCTVSLL